MTSFTPTEISAPVCENVPFESASDTATDNKADFDAFDQTSEGMNDPSRCKALLAFPDGTICWSSKMAIDGDGPAAGPGRLSGSQLSPAKTFRNVQLSRYHTARKSHVLRCVLARSSVASSTARLGIVQIKPKQAN